MLELVGRIFVNRKRTGDSVSRALISLITHSWKNGYGD